MKKIISATTFLSLTRILIGFIFLWAFLDKTFGLGFATKRAAAWIHGGSPTAGFLSHAVQGPLAPFFHTLSGMAWVDWLFMIGLLFVGITLLINRWVKFGALVGIVMLILMYLALLWPANNPFVDEHLVYAAILAYIGLKSEQ
jgi:thiosulfate dehydrogenase [quinone] large subunit